MQGWIFHFLALLMLVNGKTNGVETPNWTEENSEGIIASVTAPYCPEQLYCNSEDEGTVLPYVPDCSMFIYCDANGDEELLFCPPGLHFSPSMQLCVDPSISGCPKCGSTVEFTTETIQNTAGSTIPMCHEQPDCTDVPEGTNIPYIMNCSMYIYCAEDGVEELSFCPPGFHFSPSMQLCVDPSISGCPKCGSTIETTTEGTTIPVCPEQPACTPENMATNIPYIADCSKYIHCASSGGVIFDCPIATEFSPTQKICMDPAMAGCPRCSSGTTTTGDITTPHCLQQAECVSPDNDYKTISYAANCTQYVYCKPGGVSSIMNCPNGLHYSPTVNTCMEPELAACPQCIQTTTLPPTTPYCPLQGHCTPELQTNTIPYIADCTKYIYCQLDGSETLMTCPNKLHYSPTVHTCMDPKISGCSRCSDITETTVTGVTHISTLPYCPSQPYCTPALAGITLPYIGDCTMYIYCLSDNTEELRYCSDPQQYSPSQSKCMAPELAQCPKC